MGEFYRNRFSIDPARPLAHDFTIRDFDILEDHDHHRYLDTELIVALRCTSLSNKPRILRRIQKLIQNGYLASPDTGLTVSRITHLTPAGGTALNRHRPNRPKRRINTKGKAQLYLNHQLGLSSFTVSMELAARRRQGVSLIHEEELYARAPKHIRAYRGWPVELVYGGELTTTWLKPDRFPSLRFDDRPRGSNRRYFTIEYETGSNETRRSTLSGTSLLRKYLSYAATFEQEILKKHLGIPYFYPLFVGVSEAHRDMMRDYAAVVLKGSPAARAFRFAVEPAKPTPVKSADVFGTIWQDIKGKKVELPL